jgi:predicted ATPase
VLLTRVRVANFRSIAACDVHPGPLTVIAGPNAAGKSNFLDALRFVRDALRSPLDQALDSRGGLEEILHRSPTGERPDSFRIHLDLRVPSAEPDDGPPMVDASYMVEVGWVSDEGGRAEVKHEELSLAGRSHPFTPSPTAAQQAEGRSSDELALSRRRDVVAWHLRAMRFYELRTPVLRDIDQTRRSRSEAPLGEQGQHLARVLSQLARQVPTAKDTVDGYLSTMIENAAGLDGREVPEADVAYVVGRFLEDGRQKEIDRRSLSDGTLRLAGVLAALYQPRALGGSIPFVGIEEPEISLHPPMLGALYDALVGASQNTQVMVTTQSADLLDNPAADPDHLLVVRDDGHGSVIGPLDETGRRLLSDSVLTLPELLRSGEMRPREGRGR